MAHLQRTGFALAAALAAASVAAQVDARRAIVSVERIWDRAAHSAFTDIVRSGGTLYCAFREGSGHVPGLNGTVRVIASVDGQNWKSMALLAEDGVDLRDPKLSLTPDGSILVTIGGSFYEGRTCVKREPRVSLSDRAGLVFSPPQPAELGRGLRTGGDWLWRVTWRGAVGYGVVYQTGTDENRVQLPTTTDGRSYERVATLALVGKPNETTLRFAPNGRMIALVRREAGDRSAVIGTSNPPYSEWTWHDLGERLGGPNLLRLPTGAWLVGGRHYLDDGAKTGLGRVTTDGEFEWLVDLPSGGDTSYPGLMLDGDELLVSYYSSHEGKAAIYLARIRWKALLGRS